MAARGAANLALLDQKYDSSALTHNPQPASDFGPSVAAMNDGKEVGNSVITAEPINPMSLGAARGIYLGPWAV